MKRTLAGFRILDLTNVLAGPFCCHQLAHMGAEVIKVEVPESGDLARQLGASAELNEKSMGISFLAQNAGKKSLTLNLKTSAGKSVLKRLAKTAAAVVENFRPGVLDRLGVGYEDLKQENPQLVYCAISGFGQDGPLNKYPAYDQIIQGLSGVMSITGSAETAPLRVGYPMGDTIGGMTAAFAVASALAARAKNPNAAGCFLDVSMLESVIATMGWVVSNYLIGGREPSPVGNENLTASPSGSLNTGDGMLNIAANKQDQFDVLCDVIGRPELRDDPRFAKRQARLDHRFELNTLIEDALASGSAQTWAHKLNHAGVPAGCINTVPEALNHPQVRDRDFLATFKNAPGVGKDIQIMRTAIKVNGERPGVETPPPQLGEHTNEVLNDLGYTLEEIEALRKEGVL